MPMKEETAVALIEQVSQQLAVSHEVLSQGEREVLLLALQDIPPSQMPQHLGGVKAAAVRKRLGEIYSKFKIEGRGPGKFAKLMQMLRSLQAMPQEPDLALPRLGNSAPEPLGNAEALKADEMAANQQFVGRQQELSDLTRWVLLEARRVVAVWGMAGMGKTTLVSKCLWDWEEQGLLDVDEDKMLQDRALENQALKRNAFEGYAGVSLTSGKNFLDCIQEILQKLKAPQPLRITQGSSEAENAKVAIAYLLSLLRDHRYLIVLDGYEGVFGTRELGKYEHKYKDYDLLLRQLMTYAHQSCVLLTGREKPRSLGIEQAMNVRILQLKGLLPQAARELLNKKETFRDDTAPKTGLVKPLQGVAQGSAPDQGDFESGQVDANDSSAGDDRPDGIRPSASREAFVERLVKRYDGNPLWLKVAATTINESFNGSISDFFTRGKRIYDEQKSVLKSLLQRLNLDQQEVLDWLAINQQPVSLETLQADIFDGARRRDLAYTLRSLERCALVESPAPRPGAELAVSKPDNPQSRSDQSVHRYALQSVVQEFVTNRLIKLIADEIMPPHGSSISQGEADYFNRYCLVKANSEEHLQQKQKQALLRPLYEKLLSRAGSLAQLAQDLQQCLQQRQARQPGQVGYFASNMMSLFGELRRADGPLVNQSTQIDFSRLPIWQASFKDLQPEQFTFESCAIERADFLENLGDVFALAFNHTSANARGGEAIHGLAHRDNDLAQDAALVPHAVGQAQASSPAPALTQAGPSLLAAGDSNGRVHLWQLPGGNKLVDWQGHQSWVRCLAFSQDGRWLATGGDDNCLRLWALQPELQAQAPHLNSYIQARPALTHEEECEDWVRSLAFSADSQFLVCSSGSRISILRVAQRSRLSHIQPWHCLSHSHAVESKQPLFEPYNTCVRAVALSQDGKWLATGGDDHLIQIWDFEQLRQERSQVEAQVDSDEQTIAPVKTLRKHQGWIRALVFSPQSDRLISSSDDGTVQLWTLEPQGDTEQFVSGGPSFKAHCERVRSLAISANGQLLASGGDDCQVRLWDLDNRLPVALENPDAALSQGRIWAVALSERDGCPLLAYGDDAQTIRLQALIPQQPVAPAHRSVPDSSPLGSLPKQLPEHLSDRLPEHLVQHLPEQRPDLRPKLFAQRIKTFQGYTSSTRSAIFVPNLKAPGERPWIASGGDNHQIQIWENQAAPNQTASRRALQRPLVTLSGHQGRIWQLAYHPETQILASASDDKTIRLWNIATQDCLRILVGHSYWVRTLAFAPSGLILASAGDDETLRLWDVRSGFCLSTLGQPRQGEQDSAAPLVVSATEDLAETPTTGHHHWIRSVSFSPDGKALASGGDGKQVLLWDVEAAVKYPRSPQLPQRLGARQKHRIRAIAFSASGDWIASGNDNGDVLLWRYPDGLNLGEAAEPERRLKHWKWGVKAIAFSPDGRYLASIGDDQTIYLWDMASDELTPTETLIPPDSYGNSRGFRSVAFSDDGQYLTTGDREAWIEVWQLYESETASKIPASNTPQPPALKPRLINRFTPPRPYDGMNITHVTGIDAVRRSSLKALGAYEESAFSSP